MIKILIVDDHPVVRDGIKSQLNEDPDMNVISEASTGAEAVDIIKGGRYDVVLLDISLPDKSGLEVLEELRKYRKKPSILILSIHAEKQYAIQALRLGASGYIVKDCSPQELKRAIRKAAAGGTYISSDLAERFGSLMRGESIESLHEKLSAREFEVMLLIAEGKHPRTIAEELSLSVGTVYSYSQRIKKKMNFQGNADLVRYAIEQKLLE